MLFKRCWLAVFCMLPIIMFAHAGDCSGRESEIVGPTYREIVTEVSLSNQDCEFNWASVELPDGSVVNYMEDKNCQPYQGPCVAFSYIKVMEARLNFQTRNACRDLNFSIPWLDFAAWSADYFDNWLNEGNGVPENGENTCGTFAPSCTDLGRISSTCFCLRDRAREIGISQDLCFSIDGDPVADPDLDQSCEERWSVISKPITIDRIYANGINYIQPTSIKALKDQIVNNGPLIAIFGDKVSPVDPIYQYRSYTRDDNLRFHSFVITGWEDQPNGDIVFHVDDHWPFDGRNFCGPGKTNPLDAGTILEDIGRGFFELVRVSKVWTLSECEEAEVGVVEEETDTDDTGSNPEGEVNPFNGCRSLSVPVVTDLYTTSSRRCLTAGHMNRMLATVDCGNYGVNGLELEWSVTPGGVSSPSVSGCNAQAFIVPSTNSPVSIVRARARFGPKCPWSEWYQEDFCVDKEGDSEGPKVWGGE